MKKVVSKIRKQNNWQNATKWDFAFPRSLRWRIISWGKGGIIFNLISGVGDLKTGQDTVTDDFFTSNVLSKKLNFLRTVRSHRKDIPLPLRIKKRLLNSTLKAVCLWSWKWDHAASYISKKNKKLHFFLASLM